VQRNRTVSIPNKLQLGTGLSVLPGWLNTDLQPSSVNVMAVDVTKPFPFEDASFDYIFSEHIIEHVPWRDGKFMLHECHRVLRPGGIVRIGTPDLGVLIGLYRSRTADGEDFVKWITDEYLPDVDVYKPQFVINNALHAWGHRFLYDLELLELGLRRAGFEDVERCRYGESRHEELVGLERHGMNVGCSRMAEFETLIVEARRPL
jgi:predicted SAM-dependent methyltransferase